MERCKIKLSYLSYYNIEWECNEATAKLSDDPAMNNNEVVSDLQMDSSSLVKKMHAIYARYDISFVRDEDITYPKAKRIPTYVWFSMKQEGSLISH